VCKLSSYLPPSLTCLAAIAIYKPPDVRPILEAYQGKDIPSEYAMKEAEARAKHVEEWKKKSHHMTSSSFSGMFGLSQPVRHEPLLILSCCWLGILHKGATPRGQPPPTYLEQKRAEAQKQYTQEQKYIEANRETFDKMIQQEQEAMVAQSPGNLFEMLVQAKKSEREKSDQPLQPATQDPTKV